MTGAVWWPFSDKFYVKIQINNWQPEFFFSMQTTKVSFILRGEQYVRVIGESEMEM